jgi:hypothetical protein
VPARPGHRRPRHGQSWPKQIGARPTLLGLPGPVERAKLINMAAKIGVGVGDAAKFLSGHSSTLFRLGTGAYQP